MFFFILGYPCGGRPMVGRVPNGGLIYLLLRLGLFLVLSTPSLKLFTRGAFQDWTDRREATEQDQP